MIDLYCGVNDTMWNHHPVNPGSLVCISPVYGSSARTKKENNIRIPGHSLVFQDSGAFCDGPGERLSFSEALERQISHSEKYSYTNQVSHRASYDLLVDEKWEGKVRYKRRWSENDAWSAVKETIRAAEYMAKNYTGNKILSAQGVTANQYLECAVRILEYFNPDSDIFGLGGWCIAGKMPLNIRPSFNATMIKIIPFLAKASVKKVHIWGVMDITFLGPLLWLCDQHGLKLSTDSSGPQVRPTRGEWGYRGWRNTAYKNAPVETRGIHRALHVQLTRCWLKTICGTEFYHHPDMPDKKQNYLFDIGDFHV